MTSAEQLGIPQLDHLLGPIPPRAKLALANDPGVDPEAFLYQIAHHHLAQKRPVIYAVFNRPPSGMMRGMRDYGFDPAPHKARLFFLDGFSPLMGSSEDAAYPIPRPDDPGSVAQTIQRAALDHPDAVLILDSLSTLLDHATPESVQAAITSKTFDRFALTVASLTRWPYGTGFDQFLRAFDAQVDLKGVEERVVFSQYFVVERVSWSAAPAPRPVLYKTIRPGGVFVYIPKIVVTGPYHAGKSTFVQTLSDTAVSVNRLGTTVALDHGHLTIDGLAADIFGTPGQERFDPLLKTIAGQSLGVIVVVDASRPESFERARDMMEITSRQGLPIIVAANKQDVPGALAPAEIGKRLRLPDHIRVVGCVANNRDSTRTVLRELIGQIMLKVAP